MAGLIGVVTFVVYMLFIAGLLQLSAAIGVSRDIAEAVLAIALGGLAWWFMKDSQRIRYHEYDSGLALKPTWIAIATLVASPLVVPWYVSDRYRIAKGTLPKKPEATPGDLGLRERR